MPEPLFLQLTKPGANNIRNAVDIGIQRGIGAHETRLLQDQAGNWSVPASAGAQYSYQQPHSRALGMYQVEEPTLATYGKKYFGTAPTPQEFLQSPRIQDAFIRFRIRDLRSKGLTDDEIIKAWNVGLNGNFNSPKATRYLANVSEHMK